MFSAIIGRRREFESRPSLLWYYIWPHDVLRFDLVIRHFVSFINLVPNRVCKSDLRGRFAEQGLAGRTAFSGSTLLDTLYINRVPNRVCKSDLRGRFAEPELGVFGVQGTTLVGNCVAFWLLVCAAAMAETAGAQPSATGSVIFYNYPLAFNPAKAKLALEEKGIKYTEKKIDLFNGQSLEPWYLKLNPAGSAPTLVVGDEKIGESADIIRWADRQGTPLGGDSVDRAFVEEWLQKVDAWEGNLFAAVNSGAAGVIKFSTEFKIKVAEANAKRHPDMAELYKQKIALLQKAMAEPDDKAAIEKNLKQLTGLLDEAEAILSSRRFIAGDEYSAADAIFTPVIYRMFSVKKEKQFIDPRPNVKRYYEELRNRPSYKKVFSVSDSGLGTAKTILPALGKILLTKVTKKY